MSSQLRANASLVIGSPSIMMRSLTRTRCGLVSSPVRSPVARSSDSIMRLVEVLPLVPVMCTTGADALRVAEQLDGATRRLEPRLRSWPRRSASSSSR